MRVAAALAQLRSQDDLVGRLCADLRVIAGRDRVVAVLHQPRLWLLHTHPSFGLRFAGLLAGLQFVEFLQCRCQPFRTFPRRALLRRGPPALATLLLVRVGHLFHRLSRLLQAFADRLFPPKRVHSRLRSDLRPVVHHLFQTDDPRAFQQCQQLREQLVQRFLMLDPKISQRMMVYRRQSTQPLQPRFPLHQPLDFSCRTDSFAVGVYPQTDQQMRIPRRPANDAYLGP